MSPVISYLDFFNNNIISLLGNILELAYEYRVLDYCNTSTFYNPFSFYQIWNIFCGGLRVFCVWSSLPDCFFFAQNSWKRSSIHRSVFITKPKLLVTIGKKFGLVLFSHMWKSTECFLSHNDLLQCIMHIRYLSINFIKGRTIGARFTYLLLKCDNSLQQDTWIWKYGSLFPCLGGVFFRMLFLSGRLFSGST